MTSPNDPAILTAGLTKRYGRTTAVRELGLRVERGEIFGFLGPNGAGKTTTIRMLTGLLRPTAGAAQVAGHDVLAEPLEVKRRIGYLAERPFLYLKLTGREFLSLMGDLYQVDRPIARARAERLIDLFKLEPAAGDLIETYSKGMRQKIGLAGTLLHEPEVLFLDEPTSGLDPRSARIVKDILAGLARQGCTVFLSTHVLEIAEHMCDRVGIIDGGKLIATGSIDDLRRRSEAGLVSLEDIFLELTGGPEDEAVAAFLRAD